MFQKLRFMPNEFIYIHICNLFDFIYFINFIIIYRKVLRVVFNANDEHIIIVLYNARYK